MEQKAYYLGIDLDDENAVISYFQSNMKAPETVSTVAGSEIFQIPLVLAKKKGIGQWLIGEEARKLALRQGEGAAERLLGRALAGENVIMDGEPYAASQLLTLLVKKLIYMAGRLLNPQCPDKLVICLETLSREATALFLNMAPELGLTAEQITLIDRRRAFIILRSARRRSCGCTMSVCLITGRGVSDAAGLCAACIRLRSLSP